MKCPRCSRAIAFEATSHDCGWRAGAPGRAALPCAFDGCATPAKYNVQRREGRCDVCQEHYMRLAQEDAARWCQERGINTREQAREHLRRLPPGRFSSALDRLREPGDDDEDGPA